MTVLDQIKERIASYTKLCGYQPTIEQSIHTDMSFDGLPSFVRLDTTLITCKDCKHATMSTLGYCKYCDRLCANDDGEPDMQVNFDADFFCGFAERRDA